MLNLNPVLILPFEPDPFAVGKYEEMLDSEFRVCRNSANDDT